MTSIVHTGADTGYWGAGNGTNRIVFRNPRGNKRYYVIYKDVISSDGVIVSEYSSDGTSWTGSQNEALNNGLAGIWESYDVKIYDDGSQLEVWVVGIGLFPSTNEFRLKYAYGTISDSGSAISWNTEQTIDSNITNEGLGPYSCAIARTDNGRLIVAFTEDYRDMGKNYRQTMLIGSDGDGASPSWSGEIIWWDASASTNNQNKDEVWFGLENFSSSYPNDVAAYSRIPAANSTVAYAGRSSVIEWAGSSFTLDEDNHLYTTPNANHAKVFSLLVDESDYVHLIAWVGDDATFSSFKSASANDTLGLAPTTITTSDVDACSISLDTGSSTDVPTSDESAGFWVASGGSDLYAMIDEGYPSSDADYINSGNDDTACRFGGFNGGIVPIVVRANELLADCTLSITTFKNGSIVETVIGSQTLVTAARNYSGWTTDPDWNEIQISVNVTGSGVVLVTNLYARGPQLYAFYHKSADSVDYNYKTSPVGTPSLSSEKIVSYHQDIIALSSWSRVVENSLHIAGESPADTIIYNEHPVYKALSTTLADLVFPDQNYYLGPFST